jgi:hypothetical protein
MSDEGSALTSPRTLSPVRVPVRWYDILAPPEGTELHIAVCHPPETLPTEDESFLGTNFKAFGTEAYFYGAFSNTWQTRLGVIQGLNSVLDTAHLWSEVVRIAGVVCAETKRDSNIIPYANLIPHGQGSFTAEYGYTEHPSIGYPMPPTVLQWIPVKEFKVGTWKTFQAGFLGPGSPPSSLMIGEAWERAVDWTKIGTYGAGLVTELGDLSFLENAV